MYNKQYCSNCCECIKKSNYVAKSQIVYKEIDYERQSADYDHETDASGRDGSAFEKQVP